MQFQLKDVLTAAGPTASLIFAAWIFRSFLQERYTGSYERYRALVSELREKQAPEQLSPARRRSLHDQVGLYRRRCEQMRLATNIGVIAAIVLILGVISSVIGLMVPQLSVTKYTSVGAIIVGLILVIVAASYVLAENTSIRTAMEREVADLPDLAQQ